MKDLMHLLTNLFFFVVVKNILSESISQLAETLCMHYKCVKFSQLRPWKRTSLWVVGKTGFVWGGFCFISYFFPLV